MNTDDYQIIDNFLSTEEFNAVYNSIDNDDFPWYFYDGIVSPTEKYDINGYQFVHSFYINSEPTSPFYYKLKPILNRLNYKALLRIKANLNPRTVNNIEHGYHTDFPDAPENLRTAVFYLNDNDGLTIFEDGTKIESVANRIVIFKTNILHTGTTCTDKKRRMVINFNYFI